MKMASYKSADKKITHATEYRTDPWYGKYHHCVRINLIESTVLKSSSHLAIDRKISARREWGRKFTRNPGSWNASWKPAEITDQDVDNLHIMYDFLEPHRDHNRIMTSGDWLYIYTNDQDLIDTVCDLEIFAQPVKVTACELRGESGTVCLKTPQHRYRSYFRYRKLSPPIAQSLRNYLDNQESIRMSPSLRHWVSKSRWDSIQDHLFFDHDDLGVANMLSLIAPGITRKTQRIVADK
jgi:hypothetical protein